LKKLRIGVVYGGRSGEHEVSLASAAAVIASLDRTRYEPVPIRIEKDGRWVLADRPPTAISAAEVIEQARLQSGRAIRAGREAHLVSHPGEETVLTIERTAGDAPDKPRENAYVTGLALDVIFPVLHGPFGEDGTVQGLLELADVPYVGAGVLASAVGMDKAVMKILFAARGLPIVKHLVFLRPKWEANRGDHLRAVERELGWPVFVKPANLGSSVGISKVKAAAELGAAIDYAAEFDRKVVIEAAVPHAREIEVAVLGNDDPEASVPGEIIPSREFYDYEAKYLDDRSESVIPASLTPAQTNEIRRMALEAFRSVDASGMARIDFLLAGRSGQIFVNEINTIPGFTTISMFAKMWEASGLSYPALLDRLVTLALERHTESRRRRISVV
jgi:D-alanine-D-alanine ligase